MSSRHCRQISTRCGTPSSTLRPGSAMQAGARAQPVATSLPLEEQGSADQRNIQSMPHGMRLGSRFGWQPEQLLLSLLALARRRCCVADSSTQGSDSTCKRKPCKAHKIALQARNNPALPCIFMMQQLKASSGRAGCGHLISSARRSSCGAASFCDAHHPRGARGHYGRQRGQGARAAGPAEKNLVLDNSSRLSKSARA